MMRDGLDKGVAGVVPALLFLQHGTNTMPATKNALARHVLPWFKVILSQGIVLAGVWAVRDMLPSGSPAIAVALLLAQGASAALIGRVLGLPPAWILIQVFLPLVIALGPVLPSWLFLAGFVLILLFYWNSASEQVPLYLTNRRTWQALEALVADAKAKSFVDMGCGLGGVVTFLARAQPDLKASGVETAPLVYLAARLRALALSNATISYRSIWDENLASHDIVYCFLSPAPMPRMFEKARAEMRPGTRFVSNSFAVPDVEPERIIAVDDGRKTRLFVYRL